MTTEERKDIKEQIYDFEMEVNGLQRLNGSYIKVENFREGKDEYICNITLFRDDETETFHDVNYPKERFKTITERKILTKDW